MVLINIVVDGIVHDFDIICTVGKNIISIDGLGYDLPDDITNIDQAILCAIGLCRTQPIHFMACS